MVKQNSTVLHETVRQEIARRIHDGEYNADAALPSAAALAEEFNVSVITSKRAIRDLQTAGTLQSVPGLGTFIRNQQRFIRDLDFSLNSRVDAERQGVSLSLDLISVTRTKITDHAFQAFQFPEKPMLCVRKVVSADGAPLMLDTSYLPTSVDDKLIDEFGEKFIRDALNDNGIDIVSTKLLIDAAPASEQVQETFGVANGYPTLRRIYQMSTADPSFSVFGVTESPFDRLACTAEIEAADVVKRSESVPAKKNRKKKKSA